MNWIYRLLIFLLVSVSAFSSRAAEVESEIERLNLSELLKTSRVELYLLFNRQYENPSVGMQRLVTSTPSIFEVLKKIHVYHPAAPAACKNHDGQDVDASTISPEPDSICVSISGLLPNLDPQNARNRLLAILAREYSRYSGFNEEDALELQNEVFQLVQQSNRESTLKMLKAVIENHYMVRGAVFNFRFGSPTVLNWDTVCKTATKMQGYFSLISRADRLKAFSAFNPRQKVLFDSFANKSQAIFMGTCGQSPSFPSPNKELMWESYQKVFGNSRTISAQWFSSHFGRKQVDPFVTYRRMETLSDFGLELIEIENYVMEYLKFDYEGLKQ